jgi:MFS transporter, PAT family, beta-lactamase induction signal transducer AmpG
MSTSTPKNPLLWVPSGYFTMAIGYVMLTTAAVVIFKNLGMENAKAAEYASAFGLAYVIKPIFAPFLEMYKTKKFFVLMAQVIFGLGFLGVAAAMSMPNFLIIMMLSFWVLSFVGAAQDIATDGVYVTTLDNTAQSKFCGIQSLSWNLGQLAVMSGLIILSGYLHESVFHHDPKVFGSDWIESWRVIFIVMGVATIFISLWHFKFMPEGSKTENTPTNIKAASLLLLDTFVTFFQKKSIWMMIAFAFLFRLSIGFLDKVSVLFMQDTIAKGGLELTNQQFGLIYGTYGLGAILLGSLIGGWFVARKGLKPSLFLLCCAINIPNITFLLLSIYQPQNAWLISAGVVVEKFFFGVGSVGFMIYLMQQLAPGKYATAHYAFGTGLMGLCMMLTGIVSGHLQEYIGYINYFIFVMIATIPSFIVCWYAPFHQSATTD